MARSQIGFHVFKILEQKKLKEREIAHSGDCTIRRIAPHERTFQPLHNRQVTWLPALFNRGVIRIAVAMRTIKRKASRAPC
jgi:hypothetical protein